MIRSKVPLRIASAHEDGVPAPPWPSACATARPGTSEIVVAVAADGRYTVKGQAVDGRSVEVLSAALAQVAGGRADAVVIISADALSAHQAVVNVLDAARRAGLTRVTFAAQTSGGAAR